VNYKQLEELQTELAPRGFTVLAFPCNQFGRQEPGTAEEIKTFARETYGVTFPIFAKVRVNGAETHPVWKFLKSSVSSPLGQSIKWNFTKFVVDKNGVPVKRYGSNTTPSSIRSTLEQLLEE